MSTTLIIVLIIVVWLVVLAPLIFRGQKPIRHSGEGFNDTRVVFSGGKDVLKTPMRPGSAAARPVSHLDREGSADYELVEAEEYEIVDEPWSKRDATEESTGIDGDNETAADAEGAVIEGELVDSSESAYDAVDNDETVAAGSAAAHDATEQSAERTADYGEAAVAASAHEAGDETSAQGVHPRVVISELAPEEMYSHDETYTSPVDLLYPGVTDADAVLTRSVADSADNNADDDAESGAEKAIETAAANEVEIAPATQSGDHEMVFVDDRARGVTAAAARADREAELTLTEEELAFAARRSQRGGWNPEAERRLQAQRTKRRRNTLLVLAGLVVVLVATAIPVGGWFWALPAGAGLLTLFYLLALRGQVQQEQELRARRIRQLRRARMGVRNREDDEHRPSVNPNLRRPGATVLEVDDASPDFDELATVDYQQSESESADYASRPLRRQQYARQQYVRRGPALRSVAEDGSLTDEHVVRVGGRRVV
ncbi:hypothetical protein QP888_09090 [Corynebacterium sp. MSK297]|uniref:divisome protein SepX/GlpR n=1 Tax=Corynebacterium sp. MSK297 TaxID=3050221 RepID=UPI00254F6F40|nr:gephyrin-like molybdotransferase receptor GlpR [Corynebacterium sp. MSK297]MDK8846639.1 hypothetical protein [Corynebacterium sp. MSK297]